MKILSAPLIRQWDAYTLRSLGIPSLMLMEQASAAFVHAFTTVFPDRHRPVFVCCGQGNNGGDGLAITRLLIHRGYTAQALIRDESGSADYTENLQRLKHIALGTIKTVKGPSMLPELSQNSIIIDALFGTGLSRPVSGQWAAWVNWMNNSQIPVVAVDMPSGLFADERTPEDAAVVQADYTFTFGSPKLSFLLCQNQKYLGQWRLVEIGLDKQFQQEAKSHHYLIDKAKAISAFKPRGKCSHKGTYGHALMWAGSHGKMGAALMASRACLRAGTGLLTSYVPKCGYNIMQLGLPEAMTIAGKEEHELASFPDTEAYNAIGLGPGIGKTPATEKALYSFLKQNKKSAVLDADALNLLSQHREWYSLLRPNYILTPHPKEFERLAGPAKDDWERLEKASQFVQEWPCVLVLKSAFTSIHLPDGSVWFNTTGNPGMATGGTGDILTGMLTGLLAQGFSPEEAAISGVWWHGKAGDEAARRKGQISMIAGDVIEAMCDVVN